jgi:hypothetical protein
MTDCLGDCFERDESNRRVLKLKPNGGIRCTETGLETYPHDQNFDSNYILHTAKYTGSVSIGSPLNAGILNPSAGALHAGVSGVPFTNPFAKAITLRIDAKVDMYLMPPSPTTVSTAGMDLKVSINGTDYLPLQHSAYQTIVGNYAYTSGNVSAIFDVGASVTVTPLFVVYYTTFAGAAAAFAKATLIAYNYEAHVK